MKWNREGNVHHAQLFGQWVLPIVESRYSWILCMFSGYCNPAFCCFRHYQKQITLELCRQKAHHHALSNAGKRVQPTTPVMPWRSLGLPDCSLLDSSTSSSSSSTDAESSLDQPATERVEIWNTPVVRHHSCRKHQWIAAPPSRTESTKKRMKFAVSTIYNIVLWCVHKRDHPSFQNRYFPAPMHTTHYSEYPSHEMPPHLRGPSEVGLLYSVLWRVTHSIL